MATITLHIGTMKTGSTLIQNYLATSRLELLERDWVFPDFIEMANQSVVSASFASDHVNRITGFTNLSSEEARAVARANLAEAISQRVKPNQHWIISSENFASQLVDRAEIELLRDYFSEWFDEVRAVVYFRRQDQMLVSMLSEKFKHFGMERNRDIPVADWAWVMHKHRAFVTNHLGTFQLWESGLGEGKVTARPYLEASKNGTGILDDFHDAIGIPGSIAGTPSVHVPVNLSLRAEGIAFIHRAVTTAPEFFEDPTRSTFSDPAEQQIADALRPFVPSSLPPADERWSLRPAPPYFRWRLFDRAVVAATAGPAFTPTQEILDQVNTFYAEQNDELARAAGMDSAWLEWLAQPTREAGATVIRALSDERFDELLAKISASLAQPARGPVRQRLRARLGRVRRALRSN